MSEDTNQDLPKAPVAKAVDKQPEKKKDNTLKIILIIVGVCIGLIVLFWVVVVFILGSLFHRATKNVQVNGTGKNGSVTIKSDNGQSTATYGNGAKLTEGFPSDVPIYKPSTLVASSKTDNTYYSASIKTNDTVDKVTTYYKDELAKQGWTSVHESSYGDGNILDFKKDNRTLVLSVSNQKNETTEKTWVSLSVTTTQQ